MRSPGFRVGPKSTDWCPYRRRGRFETETQGEGHMKETVWEGKITFPLPF